MCRGGEGGGGGRGLRGSDHLPLVSVQTRSER